MKPTYDMWTGHIEITNKCGRQCLYCSRYNKHLRPDQVKDMTLDQIETALLAYKGFNGFIGIMGGEPTMHSNFLDVCKLIQSIYPRNKMALWTSGHPTKWEEYKDTIYQTFVHVFYNEHTEEQRRVQLHQPLTISIDEVVDDESVKQQLIDGCWVQRTWCCSVNYYGAYFCEIAAAMDYLLNDGKNAIPVTDGWWNMTPSDERFQNQVKSLCGKCGMCIPMKRESICNPREKVSPKILEEMRRKGLSKVSDDYVEVFDKKFTKDDIIREIPLWYPGNYRSDITPDVSCAEGRGFIGELK